MNIQDFRTTQEPLRQHYATEARDAFLTLKAHGEADASTITCKVETARGQSIAGIHPKAGGSGRELCAGDMLLEALVACAGVSMRAAAAMLDVAVHSAAVIVEGDVDLRGTLGVTEDVPVGFQEIRLRFDIDTDAAQPQLDQLRVLVEQYCVIFQTLQSSPRTSVQMNVVKR